MLEIDDVHTYYGDSYVLQGMSLNVEKGSVVALLGRNGVGKTTLIRSIMGFTPPRRGTVKFKDQNITGMPAQKVAQMGMGLVPQGRRIFPSLDVRENLGIASQPKSGGWDMERVFSVFPRLQERIRHRGNRLSGGEQQMLASARALVRNPDFLLMDEPTEGLAPLLVQELRRTVQELKDEGLSILLVEQNLPFALTLADHVYVMTKGRIVYESSPRELWENEEIKRSYLGV